MPQGQAFAGQWFTGRKFRLHCPLVRHHGVKPDYCLQIFPLYEELCAVWRCITEFKWWVGSTRFLAAWEAWKCLRFANQACLQRFLFTSFRKCFVLGDKPLGFTFFDYLGATNAQESNFKWFGGQPAGNSHFVIQVSVVDRPVAGTILRGLPS